MFIARTLESTIFKSVFVDAALYNALEQGQNVKCGDPECDAKLTYVSAAPCLGGSYMRGAHFRSLPNTSHIDGCIGIMRDDVNKDTHHMFVNDAIHRGNPIILNLNFDVGDPRYLRMGRDALANDFTRYNMFTARKNKYATKSVKSLRAVFNIARKAKAINPAAVDNIQLAHCQNIKSLNSSLVLDDAAKKTRLYKTLHTNAAAARSFINAPQIITFTPNAFDATAPKREARYINGFAVVAASNNGFVLSVQNVLDFGDNIHMRPQVFEKGSKFNIIAAPYIIPAMDKKTLGAYTAQTGFAHKTLKVFWPIRSLAQIEPVKSKATPAVQSLIFPAKDVG